MVAEEGKVLLDSITMLCLILQGEFNYSEEILNGELARIIYRDAAQKIKGDLTFLVLRKMSVLQLIIQIALVPVYTHTNFQI